MKNGRTTPLRGFSGSRREFLSTMLRSGFSLGVAVYVGDVAFAGEAGSKPFDVAYDYIIVGAGSAGCVLASRISESGYKTLLVEAGTDDIRQPKISNWADWLGNIGTETDWSVPIASQPLLGNRDFVAAAGKVLGGSGSINAMFWLRPDVRDLNRMSRALGRHGSAENFYRAFRHVERFVSADSLNRSIQGKITVGRYAMGNPLSQASIYAAGEIGIQAKDHNASEFIDGCGFADVNIEPDGTRSGPAQTYLADAMGRANFDVVTNALVTELLITGDYCRGVECIVNNERHMFYAGREVLVCAGTFGSPKLLMHSGIGSEKQLRRVGIGVKRHLPAVGDNLQDHVFLNGLSYTGGASYTGSTTLGRIATHTFFSTAASSEPPNVQIMCMQEPFPPGTAPNGHGLSLLPWIAKVESRGSVALVSADPRSPLLANPNYLTSKNDRRVLSAALEMAIAMGESSALRGYIDSPLFSTSALASERGRWDFIQRNALPGIHYVGTCAAGSEPQNSVVDENFRVWGVENLRIVDGSVLPEVPGVNPQAAILTVAEIASEIAVGVYSKTVVASRAASK